MKKSFYITTTLPYVNSDPHIGFAMEIIRADAVARYKKLLGYDVFFNTGTDEHGIKILRKAEEKGQDVKAYVDHYAGVFRSLMPALGIMDDIHFIRTTDEHHIKSAQAFWKKCEDAGDIYKKAYQVKYCVGCELEKTDSELVNGKCPDHPNQTPELIDEENYFFRFSKYAPKLLALYKENPEFVLPAFRLNEITKFVERGLEDFSISRLKSKMPWGVHVPGSDDQVMYVWFDALVNYVSTIGFPENIEEFSRWWPVVQYCGKDNLRQQSAMWQAMLMSAGMKPSEKIVINGHITSGGQKMSKSIGNVISPFTVIDTYKPYTPFPEEVLRFVLLHEVSSFDDGDVTVDSISEAYKARLQNGLGNLVSRIMKMATTNLSSAVFIPEPKDFPKEYAEAFEKYDLKKAIEYVSGLVIALDVKIQEKEPFKLVKTDAEAGKKLIAELVQELYVIAYLLNPFMPKNSAEIKRLITEHKNPETPLFARIA